MLSAIANAFKVPDLRKKILFTLIIVALYRIGCFIPVPGVNLDAIASQVSGSAALGMLSMFTGGALENFAVFAMGIMPYITASIIMQLLQAAVPTLEALAKEGESGQRKITQYTRYLTLGIGLFEGVAYLGLFRGSIVQSAAIPPVVTSIMIVASLLAGTALIMWLSELITQRGVGNGMSIIIFVSIVARFPQALASSLTLKSVPATLFILFVVLFVIAAVIFIDRGQRRIPVQYAKRVVGRRVFGGSGTYIPLKVNGANVVPIIFAIALLQVPVQLAQFFPKVGWITTVSNAVASGPVNWTITFALIVFFSYFYTALIFNPLELSDNLRKQGGFIPGIRPGAQTTAYIERVMNRIVLPGALFLGIIAVGTSILFATTGNTLVQQFGGTSILIMVSVALETMTQVESQLKMRHYEGFFK
ncbi:MAG: preprotein translocase subunit SecY [Coriobacteriia bacterium]|nr:preprotein translocase subunit SecY [Coriobacteriia bacterium]